LFLFPANRIRQSNQEDLDSDGFFRLNDKGIIVALMDDEPIDARSEVPFLSTKERLLEYFGVVAPLIDPRSAIHKMVLSARWY
jgi:hypothetical protein